MDDCSKTDGKDSLEISRDTASPFSDVSCLVSGIVSQNSYENAKMF